jgi:rod shape-determining protein MreC
LQGNLVQENQQLRTQHAVDLAQLQQRQDALAENALLRSMFDTRQRLALDMRLSRVVYGEHDPSQHKLMLNLGTQAGVTAGQAVLDSTGVIGQITRAYPLLSEVTLLTNRDHEIPAQVVRNGLRTVRYGSGNPDLLELRYLPLTADVQVGDLLVTSGIDGTYPAGLPVAKVSSIEHDPAYPYARVKCIPAAGINDHRWLFILFTSQALPARPAGEEATPVAPQVKGKKPRIKTP